MADVANRVVPPGINTECAWDELAQKLRRVTVHIFGDKGNHAAGVVWRNDGLIVTNAHVVNGTSMIRLQDGQTCPAEIIGMDRRIDLAALRIPIRGLESARLRDSRTLRAGEVVLAAGHPLGESGAISLGIIHAASDGHWITADIRLAPGNSGGPLADASGRVVGINSMVANGMGVAVSTAAIEGFLREQVTNREGAA
jgi:serine protease Do